MIAECRNCGSPYWNGEGKRPVGMKLSTADYKGYCSQTCLKDKARKLGWSEAKEKKLGFSHSWASILIGAKQVGDVEVKERQSDICECGHGRLAHVASCHVVGCKCTQFSSVKGGE